ncbi:MAG: GNAT family N-acetyltransferase [Actinomycetota bacterium]|nr:GNAT family N-acetyltransferase [Actinomycetota bacterium]
MRAGDVRLRPPVDEDRDARQSLGVVADIARMFGAENPLDGPMSSATATRWFRGLGAGGVIEWVVEVGGRFVGTARLHTIDADAGTVRYAVGFFDPSMLGRGIGRVVTELVCAHAFDVLRLREMSLTVLDFNERAQRCYSSVGFIEVSRMPSGVVVDSHRNADDLVMTLTRDAWAVRNA